jgi:ADP-heptose:LPS heptosyltransferase
VISVETSVMHLASALKVPVVALMRQKTPEWIPWDKERSTVVWAKRRRDWVKDIEIKEVITSVIKFVGN